MFKKFLLILQDSFFSHSTDEKAIKEFMKQSSENIFFCMELSKMSYIDVQQMPVQMLYDYCKWKVKHDEDMDKARQKAIESIRSTNRSRSRR